jgi:hypothetical protein
MKIGDRVMTPDGLGRIVGKDLPDSEVWRWAVRLDRPPYGPGVVCYFERDLKEVEDE